MGDGYESDLQPESDEERVMLEESGRMTEAAHTPGLLFVNAPDLLAALKSSLGYLLNAKIDLETGCTKATAIKTIEGGIAMARAAIAKAEGRS